MWNSLFSTDTEAFFLGPSGWCLSDHSSRAVAARSRLRKLAPEKISFMPCPSSNGYIATTVIDLGFDSTILTYVGEYDERVAVEAIRRELLREGQVFWVHNRVQSIDTAASRLRQLVPEARIAIVKTVGGVVYPKHPLAATKEELESTVQVRNSLMFLA